MDGKDPLNFLLFLSNSLAITSVAFDRNLGRYATIRRKTAIMLSNLALYTLMKGFYMWCKIVETYDAFKDSGAVISAVWTIDEELSFWCNFVSIVNNSLESENLLNCLNLMNAIRNKIMLSAASSEDTFRKLRYRIHLCLMILVLYKIILLAQFIAIAEDWLRVSVGLMYTTIDTCNDVYIILLNSIVWLLKMELINLRTFLSTTYSCCDWISASELFFQLLSLQPMLMKTFALPVVHLLLLLFTDTAVQAFYVFQSIIGSDKLNIQESVPFDRTFLMWSLWSMVKLYITTWLAGSVFDEVCT